MKPRFWLTMVCWALVCLLLSLSQHRPELPVAGSSLSQWLIDVENPHLARPLLLLSEARNSIWLVLDRSHLWSSRMRGLRENWSTRLGDPSATEADRNLPGCRSKPAARKQQRATLPQEIS